MGVGHLLSDDMFDEEMDEYSLAEDMQEPAKLLTSEPLQQRQTQPTPIKGPGKKRLRIRPMPPSYSEKYPDVVSIIMTRFDGRQLILVRK